MKHYKYGGSTAARQLACPGWTGLVTEALEAGEESEYAKVGTALHAIMELHLGDSDEAFDILKIEGAEIEGVEIDSDHMELVLDADEALEELERDAYPDFDNTEYIVERTFELTEDVGGTADLIVYDDKTIDIVDWKFGQGVAVNPENSAQGMFYAMVAEHEEPDLFKGRSLYITIIQPMPSRDLDTLKRWKVPPAAFKKFKRDYLASLKQAGINTGSHCQFCPAAPLCPKKTGAAKKALLLNSKDAEKLNENLKLAAELKVWCDEVLAFGHVQADEGLVLEDWKLVAKRASRKWVFEEGDKEAVGFQAMLVNVEGLSAKNIYTEPKLLTPPALEKVLKSKKLDVRLLSDYIIKQSSGTTLARADDPRDAVHSDKVMLEAIERLN